MKTKVTANKRFPVKPLRRLVQLAILLIIILIPLTAQNPAEWFPSRIVQGQLPLPSLSPWSGDTWAFSFKNIYLAHPLALFDSWLAARVVFIPLLLAAMAPLILTIILGRFFCSWMCPVGFILEINMSLNNIFSRSVIHYNFNLRDYSYPVLTALLVLSFFMATPLLAIFDPPHILGRELIYLFTHKQVSTAGTGLLLFILLFEIFANSRVLCRYFCPSGAGLALLGAKRLWRIRMEPDQCIACGKCDQACPYDLDPMVLKNSETTGIKQFNWTKCDNCGRCRDDCPTGAISYHLGSNY